MNKRLLFLLFILVLVISAGCVFPLVACQPVAKNEITGIKISHNPDKTEYIVGEEFDCTGFFIIALNENGLGNDPIQVTSDMVTFDSSTAGKTTAVVTYSPTRQKSFRVAIEVKVINPPITKIEVKTMPTRTEWVDGMAFSFEGLVLKVTYSDGVVLNVDNGVGLTYSPLTADINKTDNEGNMTLNLTMGDHGASTSIKVKVVEKSPIGLSVLHQATKTNYLVGESFEIDGLVLSLNYNDGEKIQVATNEIEYNPFDFFDSQHTYITLTARGFTLDYEVVVSEKILTSATYRPDADMRSFYYVGEYYDFFDKVAFVLSYENAPDDEYRYLSGSAFVADKITAKLGDTEVVFNATIDNMPITISIPVTVSEPVITELYSPAGYLPADTYTKSDDNYIPLTAFTIYAAMSYGDDVKILGEESDGEGDYYLYMATGVTYKISVGGTLKDQKIYLSNPGNYTLTISYKDCTFTFNFTVTE